MDLLKTIWSVLEKNRWTVIVPTIGFILWCYAGMACVAETESPTRKGTMVNAVELERDFATWQAENEIILRQFDWAKEDIESQQKQLDEVQKALVQLASGSVTTWSGLLQILVSSGLIGLFADNVRKKGVIAGLKRNKDPVT